MSGSKIFTKSAAFRAATAISLAWPVAASAESKSDAEVSHAKDIVVTATLSNEGLDRNLLGSSVTLIDAQDLIDRETRIVSDILRDVPGVAVSRAGAIGAQTQVRIRGSEGNHVLMFIDGIRVSDPYQGEFDFGTLIAEDGAKIEVLRGQQSALYGTDAIGGVISYITQSGHEAPGIQVRAEAGAFGTINASARVAGVSDTLDYVVSGSVFSTEGYAVAPGGIRDTGSFQTTISTKLAWTPAQDIKLTGVLRHSASEAETNNQGIGANSPLIRGRRIVTVVDTPGSYYQSRAWYGLLKGDLESLNGLLHTGLSGQFADIRRDAYNSSGYSYGNIGLRYGGTFLNELRFGSDQVKHRLSVAIDAQRERYRNAAPTAPDKSMKTLDTIGFIGQYNLTIAERFAIGASLRHDDNSYFNNATTWHGHASYKFSTGTRLRGAAGTGVKAPTSFELFGYASGQYIGNPDLRPEKSRGWEIGFDQSFVGGTVNVGATYFDNQLTHEIYTASVAPDYSSTSFNRTSNTHQKGIETFADTKFGDLRAFASWTWLHAPQARDVLLTPEMEGSNATGPVTMQAVRRPKYSGSFNLSYTPKRLPISGTLTVRYNGKMNDVAYTSSYAALYVPMEAYTLVNLSLRYAVTDAVGVFVRAENLFDRDYQEVLTYETPGRGFYAGVRSRF